MTERSSDTGNGSACDGSKLASVSVCVGMAGMLRCSGLALVSLYVSASPADTVTSPTVGSDVDESLLRMVAPCMACHSMTDDSSGFVGPTLKGIVGRPAAAIEDYGYSIALIEAAANGLVWQLETLERFLEAPQAVVPGIAMTYEGVAESAGRHQMLDWLQSGPRALTGDTSDGLLLGHVPEIRAVLDTPIDLEYGEYLAGECVTCHAAGDASGGVPPIHGLPVDYFINALLEYQQGERDNRIMQTMSGPLGPEEMSALAAWFSEPAQH